jgi:hypothetical protein
MSKPKLNYVNMPVKDQFQTPTYAIEPIISALEANDIDIIWEPACGEGYMTSYLSDTGYDVICTDILYGQDFFDYEPSQYDAIVTNPPFSIKYKFMERAYKLGKPFALLMPLESIGTKSAQDIFKQDIHNFSFILFNKRVKYKTPFKGWDSSPQFPSIWILYKLNLGERMRFAEIKYTKQV